MAKISDRGAVMQFEFDRKRIRAMARTTPVNYSPTSANYQAHEIIRDALQDVFDNGGTLVVVISPEKITVVQRPDAEDLADA
jgi:hypothetical protein